MTGWTRAILYARSMCSSMRWNSATSGSMASHLGHAGVHRLPQAEGLRSGALRLPARPEEDDGAAGHDHGLHGVERDIGELHPSGASVRSMWGAATSWTPKGCPILPPSTGDAKPVGPRRVKESLAANG